MMKSIQELDRIRRQLAFEAKHGQFGVDYLLSAFHDTKSAHQANAEAKIYEWVD